MFGVRLGKARDEAPRAGGFEPEQEVAAQDALAFLSLAGDDEHAARTVRLLMFEEGRQRARGAGLRMAVQSNRAVMERLPRRTFFSPPRSAGGASALAASGLDDLGAAFGGRASSSVRPDSSAADNSSRSAARLPIGLTVAATRAQARASSGDRLRRVIRRSGRDYRYWRRGPLRTSAPRRRAAAAPRDGPWRSSCRRGCRHRPRCRNRCRRGPDP